MSTSNVLRLDSYRRRRGQRLRLSRALWGHDTARCSLVDRLADVADTVAADRVAVVWVDEYGPGLVHPHVVLDLVCDRPRRGFDAGLLRRAWELGIPGGSEERAGDAPGAPWRRAVALGSDGTRMWFLTADALVPRPALTPVARDRLMFLAGECSSVVLHADLDQPSGATLHPEAAARLPGWSILGDLEDRSRSDEETARISLRFVVGRLGNLLADEDLALPPDRMREQADRARAEIERREVDTGAGEARQWHALLSAFEQGRTRRVASALHAMASSADADEHAHGACELYHTAFRIAAGLGDADLALESARLLARRLRRQARWGDAERWYGVAQGIADASGRLDRVALSLDGLANTQRERGNVPAARATLDRALSVARSSGDDNVVARVRHGILSLEHYAGDLDRALAHGWEAVRTYTDPADRNRCLASLAAVLMDTGDHRAAEDAWWIVARTTDEHYYRLYATDALSHLAALRGDRATFARLAAESDALGWDQGGPAAARAEIMLYRGLSYRALGEREKARSWLERALSFATEHRLGRILFQAEEALGSLEAEPVTARSADRSAASQTVRSGVRTMREEIEAVCV